MAQITKEHIMDQVYNLILNVETKENEREALINFKNEIEAGKEFERNLMKLAESLREISVKNISEKTTMSIGVREFYKYFIIWSIEEKLRSWISSKRLYVLKYQADRCLSAFVLIKCYRLGTQNALLRLGRSFF